MTTTVNKLACFGILLLLASHALAADIYVYQDRSGARLITDHPRHDPGYRLVKVYRTGDPWDAARDQPVQGSQLQAVPSPYDDLIQRTANFLQLDAALLKAVMHVESAFNRYAISSKGARGLMQLMPGTASRYGVVSVFDPRQNVIGGARYLRDLLKQFDNDTRLALAGYNAGENAVIRHNGIPPYSETRRYVKKVMALYKKYVNKNCDGAPSGSVIISCTENKNSSQPLEPRQFVINP